MTFQDFSCHHIKKKIDRSNFIHVFWLTESKSESSGGKSTQKKVPKVQKPDSLCIRRGGGDTLFDKGVM